MTSHPHTKGTATLCCSGWRLLPARA